MRRFLCLFSIVLVISACGEDRPSSNNEPINNVNNANNSNNTNNTNNSNNANNTNNANNSNNANNVLPGCEDVVCEDPDQRCVGGVCISNTFKVACEETNDLGALDTSASFQTSGDTTGFADSMKSSCTDMADDFSGPENVFEFTVDQSARVTVNLTSNAAIDWVMALRTDDCQSIDAELICQDPEQLTFLASADTTYFLVVEPLFGIDEGTFDLNFDFVQTVCAPVGGTDCDGTMLTRCVQGGAAEDSFQCADGCNAGVCNGDSCANPIEVTAAMTFAGDLNGYNGTLNFSEQPTCSASGQVGLNTPGQELVLSLPGLTAGQVVTVDAQTNDQNDNAIFVSSACSDQEACIRGVDLGDNLNWTVENDGNYFIIIDKTSTNPNPFNYAIDIQ